MRLGGRGRERTKYRKKRPKKKNRESLTLFLPSKTTPEGGIIFSIFFFCSFHSPLYLSFAFLPLDCTKALTALTCFWVVTYPYTSNLFAWGRGQPRSPGGRRLGLSRSHPRFSAVRRLSEFRTFTLDSVPVCVSWEPKIQRRFIICTLPSELVCVPMSLTEFKPVKKNSAKIFTWCSTTCHCCAVLPLPLMALSCNDLSQFGAAPIVRTFLPDFFTQKLASTAETFLGVLFGLILKYPAKNAKWKFRESFALNLATKTVRVSPLYPRGSS